MSAVADTVLASRQNCGLTVELHYDRDRLSVSVLDADRTYHVATFPVDKENAFDAYTHPFVYVPSELAQAHKTWQRERMLDELSSE